MSQRPEQDRPIAWLIAVALVFILIPVIVYHAARRQVWAGSIFLPTIFRHGKSN